ncbi:hypothetical protein CEXT_492161 [Caerostris extrusa]|uniref:Uncharacterized protein n=1 Tax=Caerostris extrusa TaxID=172846 RepID=A0AAV4NS90_CAEEX|nr:hypothetical protein CEXT_492161 [Caerostris extrusa]
MFFINYHFYTLVKLVGPGRVTGAQVRYPALPWMSDDEGGSLIRNWLWLMTMARNSLYTVVVRGSLADKQARAGGCLLVHTRWPTEEKKSERKLTDKERKKSGERTLSMFQPAEISNTLNHCAEGVKHLGPVAIVRAFRGK